MSNELDRLMSPARLAGLTLRNRVIKTATFEGMCPGGVPGNDLINHHAGMARGGVGLTTVAYCGVSPDGLTFPGQMWMHAGVFPQLQRLASAVHAEGGAVSAQLAHCGYFTRNKPRNIPRPRGPSACINQYGVFSGVPFGGAMDSTDIARTWPSTRRRQPGKPHAISAAGAGGGASGGGQGFPAAGQAQPQ